MFNAVIAGDLMEFLEVFTFLVIQLKFFNQSFSIKVFQFKFFSFSVKVFFYLKLFS